MNDKMLLVMTTVCPETLERLANDDDSYVRCGVALNFFTPQYIKDYLKIKEFLNYNTR